jgi:hypothetical protein
VQECAPYSLTALNEKVLDWINHISTKPLEELGESRETRFMREKTMLTALPRSAFDVRDAVPLVVSRESTIRYETNRYSVPPQYIGTTVQLLVHPLYRTVDLVGPQGHIRRFPLAAAESHATCFFPDDRALIAARWKRDQGRIQRMRTPRKKVVHPWVDVEIRSPSTYDTLIAARHEALL